MSRLGYLVDPLREMLQEWGPFLHSYAAGNGIRPACLPCDIVPHELLSAYGFLPLRIPFHLNTNKCECIGFDLPAIRRVLSVLDPVFIVPDVGMDTGGACGTGAGPVHRLAVPSGYGEDAAITIHEGFVRLIRDLTGEDLESLPGEDLAKAVGEYDTLKRLVRGILSIRPEKPGALSQNDLHTLMEGALCLPPPAVSGHLALVLRHLNGEQSGETAKMPRVMAVGGSLGDGTVLDSIEEAGCIVTEDDSCLGRRNFDISYPVGSAGLYEQMIHALSFRPLCPSLRPAGERFELLYRGLGNYGIDLVVFIEDTLCPRGREQMEYLRLRLMRSGIDPLVVDAGSAREKTERYRKETGLGGENQRSISI